MNLLLLWYPYLSSPLCCWEGICLAYGVVMSGWCTSCDGLITVRSGSRSKGLPRRSRTESLESGNGPRHLSPFWFNVSFFLHS